MKHKIYLLLIFLIGLINFLPVLAMFSLEQLSQAYAVDIVGNDLEVLMRHRALLFGILGGFVFFSLFKPIYRMPALIMTGLSMIGFLILVWTIGGVNSALIQITVIDFIGLLCLILALALKVFSYNEKF